MDKTTCNLLRSYPSHWCNGSFSWNGWRISITMNTCRGPRREMCTLEMIGNLIGILQWFWGVVIRSVSFGQDEGLGFLHAALTDHDQSSHRHTMDFSYHYSLSKGRSDPDSILQLATSMKILRENQLTDHQFLVLGGIVSLDLSLCNFPEWQVKHLCRRFL